MSDAGVDTSTLCLFDVDGTLTAARQVGNCVYVRAREGKTTGDIKQSVHLTNLQTNMTVLSDTATSGSTLIL